MSLILDALKKAENERKRESTSPNVDTVHAQPSDESRRSQKWVLGVSIILFISLCVFVLSLLLLREDPSTPIPTPTPNPVTIPTSTSTEQINDLYSDKAETQDQPSLSDLNHTSQEVIEAKQLVRASQNTVKKNLIASQYQTGDFIHEKEKIAKQGSSAPIQPHTQTKLKDIENLYNNRSLSDNLSSAEKIQIEPNQGVLHTPPTNTVAHPQNVLAAFEDIKLIKELPLSVQKKIPTMMYTKHTYTNDKNTSAVINGKVVRERASIASGVRLDKILKDGLLLSYQNQEFKMRALNSWINY